MNSARILNGQSTETTNEAQFSGLSDQTASAHVDWSQLGYNNSHTGFNPFETALSVSTVSGLRALWTVTTGDLSAAPAVVKGIVYVGSGDGNIYAVKAATGAIRWKTFLQGAAPALRQQW
jgi:polyvinyl alcohol dehydrogenase (cytochrome)